MKGKKWKLGVGIVLILAVLLGCTSAFAFGTYTVGTQKELLHRDAQGSTKNDAVVDNALSRVTWINCPTNIRATSVNNKVTLSWDKVSAIDFYSVYEKINGYWTPLYKTTPLTSVNFIASDGSHTYGVSSVYASATGDFYESKYVTSVTVNVLDGSDRPNSGSDIITINLSGTSDQSYEYTVYDNTYLHIHTDSLTWYISEVGALVTPDMNNDNLLFTELGNDFYLKGIKHISASSLEGKLLVSTYSYTTSAANGSVYYSMGDKRAYFRITLKYQSGNAPTPTPEPTATPAPETTDTTSTVNINGGKYIVNGDEATYTGATAGSSSEIVIPEKIQVNGQTVKVITIADKAFANQTSLTRVKIGKNVKTIGKNAFSGCKNLKTVDGGNNVVTIKDGAFKGCSSLTKITLQSKVKKIGKNAFNGCKKLKTITIKTKLLKNGSVGSNAFKGTPSNATVKCPSGKANEYKGILQKKGISKKAKFK